MLTNFHTHTTLCDGKNSPAEMAEAAYEKGFAVLGFSGHMDPVVHVDLARYRAEIRALREAYTGRMDILLGVELDQCWSGEAPVDMEYIIGATHHIRLPDGSLGCVDWSFERSQEICQDWFAGDWYKMAAAYYEAEARVVERTRCDVIAHFDLVARFNHERPSFDEEDPRYLRPAMEALETLAATDAVIELNCGAYNRGRRKDFYPARPLLKRLRELKAPVCLNSDAHDAALLDGGFADARAALRAIGFTELTVWKHGGSADTVIRAAEKL